HFGFRMVDLAAKQRMVDAVFHRVARRYDLMNDLMSGGLHRFWKDAMVGMLDLPRGGRYAVVDVAGGTGDVAFRIAEAGGPRTTATSTTVTVCDVSPDMLAVGRERARARRLDGAVRFAAGNAEALPLPDRSQDACTIAFGIRNVSRIDIALREFHRVLRPGGRLLCLEFSTVDVPGLDRLYDLYSFNVIPALGRAVTGDAESYRYLVESIRRFPRPQAFADMIAAAGFRRTAFRLLTGGVVALHSAWRL
ncbi:MAG: bifunctional demethylmenaquinone methyltransferase/2-methoxy-6-polyprenyl-1,4-benzoquinol methylase UbiE, partial [Xanthobacteraceae bacterium]|nr:bifunctional demethylmenaquinone methyltransferase/2-methoxy-6-polyprenyl-1,4-benzoquinol methylase UbiE [Xanthobacteraceae bacterium]